MQYASTFKLFISQILLLLTEKMLLRNIHPSHTCVLSASVFSNGHTKLIQDPRHGMNGKLCFEPALLNNLLRSTRLWVVGYTPPFGPNHGILSFQQLHTRSMRNVLWDGPATAPHPDLTTLLLLQVSHPHHLPHHSFR